MPTGAPQGVVAHDYRYTFPTLHPQSLVWAWSNDPATFTAGRRTIQNASRRNEKTLCAVNIVGRIRGLPRLQAIVS